MGTGHVPLTPNSACALGRRVRVPLSCVLPSKSQRYVEHFRKEGGICYEKWHSAVLGGTRAKLTAVRSGGQMGALALRLPRHSCVKASRRLPATCWDFFVHVPACTGYVLFCKPASVCWLARNTQVCALPHVCWMPLAHQERGLKVLP